MSESESYESLHAKLADCVRALEKSEKEVERLTEVNDFLIASLKAAFGIEIEIEDDTDE